MAARLKLSAWIVLTVAVMSWLISCVARGEDGEPRLLYFPVEIKPEEPPITPQALIVKRQVKRLRILFFTATWCQYCPAEKAKLLAYLKTSPTPWEIDETEFAHCQIVDADKRPELVQKYRVTGLPTVMLIDGEKEVKRGPMMDVFAEYSKLTAQPRAAGSDLR